MQLHALGTLLILGDSLSAGYQLPADQIWTTQIKQQWEKHNPPITVINASISGNTVSQSYTYLPDLLEKYNPDWVLIELGANDGMSGFNTNTIKQDLSQVIATIQDKNAQPILMQIRLPLNYSKRYHDAFSQIYPDLAKEFNIPLIPFFLEDVIIKPEWMLSDGIHPNLAAQPFITQWMNQHLLPLLQHEK